MNFLPDKSAAEVGSPKILSKDILSLSGCDLILHKQCSVIVPYYIWLFFRIKKNRKSKEEKKSRHKSTKYLVLYQIAGK